jgi:PTS system mannose-specific IIB component
MGLVHFRVDDRLVHGIVAGYWTNHLEATRIMVIDDEASVDEMRRQALRMATPPAVNLSVLNLEKAAANIKAGNYEDQRVFVIARNPAVFTELQKRNIEIPAVYMGNITYTPERRKVSKTVALNSEDEAALEYLISKGCKIISQLIPGDKADDFAAMMNTHRDNR